MTKSANKFSVPGFLANGVSAGIKGGDRKDLGLICSTVPARVAALFTKNTFKAAPVLIDAERVKRGTAQAILTNNGCAARRRAKKAWRTLWPFRRRRQSS